MRFQNVLRSQQQMTSPLDGRARIFRELLIRGAADWVANRDELVSRHAKNPAHEFGRTGKAFRHYADRRYTLPLRCYRIVQTAR